jgi:membrane protease YdiL (CAAX protease family)
MMNAAEPPGTLRWFGHPRQGTGLAALGAFCFGAVGLSTLAVLLTPVSIAFGFLALFGPALSATVVEAATAGRSGVTQLLKRLLIWRVGLAWYVVVLGLPPLLALVATGLAVALGAEAALQPPTWGVADLVLFVLVVGEEIGWRGYALPRLLARTSPLVASVVLGLLWAGWHLPAYVLPGTPQFGSPFGPFLVWVVAQAVLFTWVFNHTRGSLLLATLFHGSIDSFGIFLPNVDFSTQVALKAPVYAAVASVVAAWEWRQGSWD